MDTTTTQTHGSREAAQSTHLANTQPVPYIDYLNWEVYACIYVLSLCLTKLLTKLYMYQLKLDYRHMEWEPGTPAYFWYSMQRKLSSSLPCGTCTYARTHAVRVNLSSPPSPRPGNTAQPLGAYLHLAPLNGLLFESIQT